MIPVIWQILNTSGVTLSKKKKKKVLSISLSPLYDMKGGSDWMLGREEALLQEGGRALAQTPQACDYCTEPAGVQGEYPCI